MDAQGHGQLDFEQGTSCVFIFLSLTLLMFVGVLLRYFILAGMAYWTCWIFKCEALQTRRIDGGMPESSQLPKFRAQMQSEIFYSILACAIFALAGSGIYIAWKLGWTKVYLDISQYGWGYFFLSFWIAAFFHETYFYWTHRWMHGVRVFRKVHKVHHDSKSPTPWAAFSFHPWESLIEAIILPLIILMLPLHPLVILANLVLMSVFGVINHCGYELYPESFAKHKFWKYWVSATHHQAHHSKLHLNFGLYFTVWDRWMGTHHEHYEKDFDAIHARGSASVELVLSLS